MTYLWHPVEPSRRRLWVDRPRLRDALEVGHRRAVTVVTAPSGSGKSLLVADWLDHRPGKAPAIWITVDPVDTSATSLWAELLEAVREVVDLPAGHVFEKLLPSDGPAFGAALIDGFAALPGPVTVVVDDVHLADGPLPQLGPLIEADTALRMVLIGRTPPPIPIPRLRLAGLLSELGSDDLAFDDGELTRLLRDHELPDTADVVTALAGATGGWPAGARLIAMDLRRAGVSSAGAAVDRIRALGRDEHTTGTLVAGLLNGVDAELRELLARLCVVDTIDPRLAAVLAAETADEPLTDADRVRTVALLDRLATQQLLLDRVAGPQDDAGSFRIHPLLLDPLRTQLARRPDLRVDLLVRAARWFEDHDRPLQALDCAVQAEHRPLAGRIALRTASALLAGELRASLLAVLQRIPDEVIIGDANLTTAKATLACCLFDLEGLAGYLTQAREAIDAAGDVDDTTLAAFHLLAAKLADYTADAQTMLDEASAALAVIRRMSAAEVPAWSFFEDFTDTMVAQAELWTGLFDEGIARLVAREARPGIDVFMAVRATAARAIGLALAGRGREAREAAASAIERTRDLGWDHGDLTAGAWAADALAATDRADVEGASAALRMLAPMIDSGSVDPFITAAAESAAVLVDLLRSGPGAAADRLAGLGPVAWPGGAMWQSWIGGLVQLAERRPAAALDRLGSVGRVGEGRGAGGIDGRITVLAGWCHARLDDWTAAAELLDEVRGSTALQADLVADLDARLLAAAVAESIGQHDTADAELAAALGGTDGTDQAGGSTKRLTLTRVGLVAGGLLDGPLRRRERLAAVALTNREHDVLRYLPSLLTVEQIAVELGISVHTVRHHAKSIRRKLGVTNRRDAGERAKELGLLEEGVPMGPSLVGRPRSDDPFRWPWPPKESASV